jgi:hypothetical protein
MTKNTTKTTVRGSCHCGAIQFEVDLALDGLAPTMCNCRICTKLGALGTIVKPDAFRALAGEASAGLYGKSDAGRRVFCKTCSVYCFGRGTLEMLGGDYVSVNVNTLDGIDPYALPRMHWDGRHDNWQAGPRATPWPIGLMAL